ncbi:hypothetical protein DFQ27_004131, partial [Actinomortierella ambigua]
MTTPTILTLFCVVDGESTSNAFPVKISPDDSIGDLKKLIKTEIPGTLNGVDAKDLTLWRVNHVIAANIHQPVLLSAFDSTKELAPIQYIADVFTETPPRQTIHLIVQRPPPQGDPHADIKRITDEFFAPGSDVT